ncbi:MAG: type I restriction endonuclease subunit R [Candidatus Delongbacteria bacterium]|nr:type I restriction endonuclease subunit R [Candidatus Delongbacteria bacterium]
MTTQPEAILENNLIDQLVGLNYERVLIHDEDSLLSNLKVQLGAFNNTVFSDREFNAILNHLEKGNIFQKSKTLRDRFYLTRDDGDSFYVRFFNNDEWNENIFQVTNQVTQVGTYKNRYDVTILINGLPLVQIELKRRGLELKEAFNQINRYQLHSFWTNRGLFNFVQMFVISNEVDTKYYANNRQLDFMQTFFWADKDNRNITDLTKFTDAFLNTNHLGKMISHYIVHNETFGKLMILRPYQYYAVESIIEQVQENKDNGYIWHTTGSGKTLTSFKASQIIMNFPTVKKVVFVVDRKDLDYQTMNEFNNFKKDSVDTTENTKGLLDQLKDDTKLIVTTIQKLNNAIKDVYSRQIWHLRDERVVFIFDECHRSQFGETHKRITKFFNAAQLFGFTGTPIFAENSFKTDLGKRTTKDLFGECLHKYVITDAIRDQNVLKFNIEYIGRYRQKGNTFIDIEVEDIDTREILDSSERLEKIADHIIKYHDEKTHRREFSSIFAISGIDNLIKYYEIFKAKKDAGEHDLRIGAIFTYGANDEIQGVADLLPEEEDYLLAAETKPMYNEKHNREKLDDIISDYNEMYGTNYSTQDGKLYENYFKDISKRLKEREKPTFNDAKDRLDILLVVNMFLTGFDAKKVNTLYVDKNLRYHGIIQAFSRTNRIYNKKKSQGNILCFRNLKHVVDDAITLFSNKEAIEDIIIPPYEAILRKFSQAFSELLTVAPTVDSVNDLITEEDEMKFIKIFRELIRLINVLKSYVDFSWKDLPMSEQSFADYRSKYLDLYDKVKNDKTKDKSSILNDIDFEVELLHRDVVNVAYIIKLIGKMKQDKKTDPDALKKFIYDKLAGEVELRSKRELIEKFIEENLPLIDDIDSIEDEFEKFWSEEKRLALKDICEEENLDQKQFAALIDAYIFNSQEPLRDDVFKCLDQRPSVLQAREIGDRIIERMKEFIETFVQGMVA